MGGSAKSLQHKKVTANWTGNVLCVSYLIIISIIIICLTLIYYFYSRPHLHCYLPFTFFIWVIQLPWISKLYFYFVESKTDKWHTLYWVTLPSAADKHGSSTKPTKYLIDDLPWHATETEHQAVIRSHITYRWLLLTGGTTKYKSTQCMPVSFGR